MAKLALMPFGAEVRKIGKGKKADKQSEKAMAETSAQPITNANQPSADMA